MRLDNQKCPNYSEIKVYVDMEAAINGCSNVYSVYSGFNITIEIISQSWNPNVKIEFKSVKNEARSESCYPHFDCGDMHCVPMETKCDGFSDCHNVTDEFNCITDGHVLIFFLSVISVLVVIMLTTLSKIRRKKNEINVKFINL